MEHEGPLDLPTLWQDCLVGMIPLATSPVARQWLQATQPVGFSDDTIVLAAPHSFAREWLDDQLGSALRGQLAQSAGRPLTVVITVAPNAASLTPSDVEGELQGAAETAGTPGAHAVADPHIDPRATLPPDVLPESGDQRAEAGVDLSLIHI